MWIFSLVDILTEDLPSQYSAQAFQLGCRPLIDNIVSPLLLLLSHVVLLHRARLVGFPVQEDERNFGAFRGQMRVHNQQLFLEPFYRHLEADGCAPIARGSVFGRRSLFRRPSPRDRAPRKPRLLRVYLVGRRMAL